MDEREPILLKDLPEPLRTFAYYNMTCSHMNYKPPYNTTDDDNPYVFPEVVFYNWNELAENLNSFLEKINEPDSIQERAEVEEREYRSSL